MLADDIITAITKHPQLREALEEMDKLRRDIGLGQRIESSMSFVATLADENNVPVKITIAVGLDDDEEAEREYRERFMEQLDNDGQL